EEGPGHVPWSPRHGRHGLLVASSSVSVHRAAPSGAALCFGHACPCERRGGTLKTLHRSKEVPMATYIVLGQFTDQGIRNVADTSKRADAVFWTIGRYDVALILEAPDDETMTVFGLSAGKLGNVRTETLRAFSQAEIGQILKRVV